MKKFKIYIHDSESEELVEDVTLLFATQDAVINYFKARAYLLAHEFFNNEAEKEGIPFNMDDHLQSKENGHIHSYQRVVSTYTQLLYFDFDNKFFKAARYTLTAVHLEG